MKLALIIIGTLTVLVLIGLVLLAHQSKSVPKLGLVKGQLAPCVQTTNCINSMENIGVDAISFKGTPDQAWVKMRQTVEALGGTIEQQTDNYLWATFSTPLFGFVDDVELLIEPDKQQFQIRSASRVGRSDFSANRHRIEAIRNHFERS